MTKKVPVYLTILLILAAVIVTFNATYIAVTEKQNAKLNSIISEYSFYDELLTLDKTVKGNYIGEIDDSVLKSSILEGYINGIGDKYSAFLTKDEYETFLNEQDGSTVGIGVSVIYDNENMEIISVIPSSPAEEAGMQPGDLIVAVDGKPLQELGYYGAVDMIKGDEGTDVHITYRRDGKETTVTCVRKHVTASSVEYRAHSLDASIGVVRITEFNTSTPADIKNAVEKLRNSGCTKFIFDLRNNGGGELNSIVGTLDFILPEGPIVLISFANGTKKDYDSDEICMSEKIAVIVNSNTASAAELFACSIQDYAHEGKIIASVIGVNTYGKGVLQSFYTLKNGDAFKISSGRYDPPYSENYDGKGVIPDIFIELSELAQKINFYKLTDDVDNQMAAAVEYLNK
ncbi:MAG: PDZ domain-containing protein [Clostridia bacterium]|nr:PDZ domain-containing protein [Clostridia bacterium]